MGATKLSNNTGELSAAAELLLGLLDESVAPPPDSRGVIRPDSELVMGVMTGRVAVKENVMLAKRVRELWLKVRARYGGRLTHRWIKGHSSHVWNDRADALAELGRLGDIHTVRDEWQEAKDAHEHVPLVSLVGRFAFSVRRSLFVQRDALTAKVYMRTDVNTRSFQWIDAGRMPTRIHVQHAWESNAVKLMADAREEETGWKRGLGSSTVAVLMHPGVIDELSARRGMHRFQETTSRTVEMHTVPAQSEPEDRALPQVAWRLERFNENEASELAAVWCRPLSPPPASSDSSDEGDDKGGDEEGDESDEAGSGGVGSSSEDGGISDGEGGNKEIGSAGSCSDTGRSKDDRIYEAVDEGSGIGCDHGGSEVDSTWDNLCHAPLDGALHEIHEHLARLQLRDSEHIQHREQLPHGWHDDTVAGIRAILPSSEQQLHQLQERVRDLQLDRDQVLEQQQVEQPGEQQEHDEDADTSTRRAENAQLRTSPNPSSPAHSPLCTPLSNLNPSSPPPPPFLPHPNPREPLWFSRHKAFFDLLAARRRARQAHKAYWQATFPGNGRWVGPNTDWVHVADDSELSMRCIAADSQVASAELKLKQVSNPDSDPSPHASMYDTSQSRTCEQSGEDDENSAESSVEEWEATTGGGFTRVQPSGRATSPPGEWYVYGFEPDGCGGCREIRRPAGVQRTILWRRT